MKILMGHCFYRTGAPSGEDAVYRNERKLLESYGHEVIPFEKFNDDIDDSTIKGKISAAWDTAWSQDSYNSIEALIKKIRPDVAHFQNTFPQMSPSVYAACQDNNVPVVQSLHNYRLVCANGLLLRQGKPCEDCLTKGVFSAIKHRCYRNSLPATSALVWMQISNRRRGGYINQVNRYIIPTQFSIPRLVQGGLPEYRLAVKPNFLPDPPMFNGQREGYVVFVGRLTAEKGVHTLIQAWKKLPHIQLKILGDGEMRQSLELIVRENRLNVEFLGYQPRDAVLLAVSKAALQIIPSECYEGFPMALLEAYASGTPVLVSRIGSLDELVVEDEAGIKFEAGNPEALANAVQDLMTDPSRLIRLGRQANRIYLHRYTSGHNYGLLVKIYQDAIADFNQNRLMEKRA